MMARDQRKTLRVPVRFQVRIRNTEQLSFYGECTDLSVTGMTIQTSFVPRPQEELEIHAVPPKVGNASPKIFAAHVRVMRCHVLEEGKLYELGLQILEVLS